MLRRAFLSTIGAATMLSGAVPLAALSPIASADDWCSDGDPPVTIVTPAGHRVVVYVELRALGTEHLPALLAADGTITYSVRRVQGGGRGSAATAVTVRLFIDDDSRRGHFQTQAIVRSGPNLNAPVLAFDEGHSGQRTVLHFTLDTP